MPDPHTSLAQAFAKAGFSAAQNSLADIALDWFRAYLERPEVVERAAETLCTLEHRGEVEAWRHESKSGRDY